MCLQSLFFTGPRRSTNWDPLVLGEQGLTLLTLEGTEVVEHFLSWELLKCEQPSSLKFPFSGHKSVR